MTAEQRAKDFASWLIIHTEDVNTIGACRRYKGITYNVDELYDKWVEYKNKTKQKF
jgi:hypothetical protein